MITVPLWLFASVCAIAVLSLLSARSLAQRTVDRILADELDRHWDNEAPAGFDGTRPNAKHPVLVTITDQVPHLPRADAECEPS